MSSPSPDPGPEGVPAPDDWRCYRHPDRDVGVRCTRCARPICPDCMIQAPVGFQCPTCVRAAPPSRRLASLRPASPQLTYAVVAVNAVVFLLPFAGAQAGLGAGDLRLDYGLFGPAVAAGQWWRIATSAFLHADTIHLLFNMFILYQLGLMLEPALGRLRFGAVYAAGVFGGSLGALLLTPYALTVGASGAVFGLMGAAVVGMRSRGINPLQSGIGILLGLNLVLTFVIPNISIGGHLGGLGAGAAAGAVVFATDGRERGTRVLGGVVAVAVAAACAAAALGVAANPVQ